MEDFVPVVDLCEEENVLLIKLKKALEGSGFFYLKNYGFSADKLLDISRWFFSQEKEYRETYIGDYEKDL